MKPEPKINYFGFATLQRKGLYDPAENYKISDQKFKNVVSNWSSFAFTQFAV